MLSSTAAAAIKTKTKDPLQQCHTVLHSLAYLPRAAQCRLCPYQLILCLGSVNYSVDSTLAADLGLRLLHMVSSRAKEIANIEWEANAKSGPTEHEAPQPHRSPANRSLHRGDPYHYCSRHLLRVQHRPLPMGSPLSLSLSLNFKILRFLWFFYLLLLVHFQSLANGFANTYMPQEQKDSSTLAACSLRRRLAWVRSATL